MAIASTTWLWIVVLALSCVLTLVRVRRIARCGRCSRRAQQRQLRLYCFALVLCAAMLLLLPLLDAPSLSPLQALVTDAR